MLLLGGAFTVLLLISGASAVIVLPPTNVKVTCRNTNVSVRWDYSEDHPQTEFTVNISSPYDWNVFKTRHHQQDLSKFVWKSELNFMESMSVSVTAVQGGSRSEEGKSQTFTFNDFTPARLKCLLDFPPVDLDFKDSKATVTFQNPVHQSKELKMLNNYKMSFNVTAAGVKKTFKSDCLQDICRLDFVYPDNVTDKCVNLTGHLWFGTSPLNFTKKENICHRSIEPYQVVLIIVLVGVGLLVAALTIIICVTKAWALKNASLPEFLEDFDGNLRQQIADVHKTSTSSVTVYRPCRNPSVSSGDSTDDSDDSTHDSVKTECVMVYMEGMGEEEEVEEEEEQQGGYDRPHVVQVDLGDGDMATGYTERNVSL